MLHMALALRRICKGLRRQTGRDSIVSTFCGLTVDELGGLREPDVESLQRFWGNCNPLVSDVADPSLLS